MTRSLQEALAAHFEAVASGDIERLLADYSEDATILTRQRVLQGRAGVEEFFTVALRSLPGAQFALVGTTFSSDAALVYWTAEADAGRIDDGVDTFVFEDGHIRLQAVHFTIQQA